VQTLNDAFNFVSFPHFPNCVRSIEHEGLAEEDKRNPLVVGVIRDIVFFSERSQAKEADFATRDGRQSRNRKSGRDETIVVDDLLRDCSNILDAVDVFSDILSGSDEDGTGNQNDESQLIMKLEDGRGDLHCSCLQLNRSLQFGKRPQHFLLL